MTEEHRKDIEVLEHPEMGHCPCPVCGVSGLIVDVSMALIQCDSCGISFEYRYDRGVIPFYTILKGALS